MGGIPKYIIHSCNQRLWFVEEYIIPSLVKQGIAVNNIDVWNDNSGKGCLASFLDSCDHYYRNYKSGGAWHLQDDIIISSDFRTKTILFGNDGNKENCIVCGYYNRQYDGYIPDSLFNTTISNYDNFPDSFQCIYVPFHLLGGVRKFVEDSVFEKRKYIKRYGQNKYDDFFFKKYLFFYKKLGKEMNLIVCSPTIVEHVSELIGGSTVNREKEKIYRNKSNCFTDVDAVNELLSFLKERNGTTED